MLALVLQTVGIPSGGSFYGICKSIQQRAWLAWGEWRSFRSRIPYVKSFKFFIYYHEDLPPTPTDFNTRSTGAIPTSAKTRSMLALASSRGRPRRSAEPPIRQRNIMSFNALIIAALSIYPELSRVILRLPDSQSGSLLLSLHQVVLVLSSVAPSHLASAAGAAFCAPAQPSGRPYYLETSSNENSFFVQIAMIVSVLNLFILSSLMHFLKAKFKFVIAK